MRCYLVLHLRFVISPLDMELSLWPQIFMEHMLCMQICCDLWSLVLWKPWFINWCKTQGQKYPWEETHWSNPLIFFFFHTSYNDAKTTSFPGVRTLKIAFMALQSHLRTLWHNLLLLLGHSSGHYLSLSIQNWHGDLIFRPLTSISFSMSLDTPWHFSLYLTLQNCLSSSFHIRLLSQEKTASTHVLWPLELHCQVRQKTQQMVLLDII